MQCLTELCRSPFALRLQSLKGDLIWRLVNMLTEYRRYVSLTKTLHFTCQLDWSWQRVVVGCGGGEVPPDVSTDRHYRVTHKPPLLVHKEETRTETLTNKGVDDIYLNQVASIVPVSTLFRIFVILSCVGKEHLSAAAHYHPDFGPDWGEIKRKLTLVQKQPTAILVVKKEKTKCCKLKHLNFTSRVLLVWRLFSSVFASINADLSFWVFHFPEQ